MSKRKTSDAAWWVKNFPTVSARAVADKAIDVLDVNEPMSKYVDVWIAAYLAAGGRRP